MQNSSNHKIRWKRSICKRSVAPGVTFSGCSRSHHDSMEKGCSPPFGHLQFAKLGFISDLFGLGNDVKVAETQLSLFEHSFRCLRSAVLFVDIVFVILWLAFQLLISDLHCLGNHVEVAERQAVPLEAIL